LVLHEIGPSAATCSPFTAAEMARIVIAIAAAAKAYSASSICTRATEAGWVSGVQRKTTAETVVIALTNR